MTNIYYSNVQENVIFRDTHSMRAGIEVLCMQLR